MTAATEHTPPSDTHDATAASAPLKGGRRPGARRRRLRVEDVNVVDRPMLRRAVGGTVVGNTMEWYDVGVYGYLAVTMGAVFLPEAATNVQVLFSLGVFAATYVARPLGGIICGRIGDKLGRQKVLAVTLVLMAASTFAIGLLPTYSQIGAAAPVMLVVLKLLQGFSTGGEYAGVTTFVSEHAPDSRRGYFAAFLDFGSYMGFAVGAAVVSGLQLTLGNEALLDGAWRIPFLIAGPLGAIAIWFRLRIEETPAFKAQFEASETVENAAKAMPARPEDRLRAQWKRIVVAMLVVAVANTAGYALTSYMPTYLTDTLGYDAVHGTLLTIPVLVLMSACIPVMGRLSDRIGRRPVLWMGTASLAVLSVPAFLLLGAGHVWTTLAGLAVMAVPVAFMVSTIASALPAQFPTAVRYGSMGISYNIAVAVFGGTSPLIIESLLQATGNSLTPAFYLMGTAVVGAIAIAFMQESAKRPLPGAMPSVETPAEARELVATQEDNPDLDLEAMPLAR